MHTAVRPPSSEVTVSEAAAVLGVDRKTILRWITANELQATRKLPGRTGSYLLDAETVASLAAARAER